MKKYFVLPTLTILIAYLTTFIYRYRNIRIAEKKALKEDPLDDFLRKEHAEEVFSKLSDQLFKALTSEEVTESYRLEEEYEKQNVQFNQLYTML